MLVGQMQQDIDRLDGGGSAYIYGVTSEVVLKAPVTFCPLPEDASRLDRYEFAQWAFFYHDDIRNERDFLSQLEKAPHPNVIQPIALEYAEGLYLRRYLSLASILSKELPPRLVRKAFYRDMLRALKHLHELKIAHADVRIDNFLWADGGSIILCDFTCSRLFGGENPSFANPPEISGVNGPHSHVSDITDRFALGSVIFEISTGSRPSFCFDGTKLKIPPIQTGDAQLDTIIRKS